MTGLRNFLTVAFAVAISIGSTAQAADVIVVCPSTFREALGPWLDHRRSENLDVSVIASQPDAVQLQASIREASDADTKYILLVGDAPVIGQPCNELRQTPILYSPTSVTKQWGSTPTLSSDMMFGDFDDDQVPDAVVGRLPVDEPPQLKRLVARILARESSVDFGPWRSQIQLVGGIGGFGLIADSAIESVTRSIVTGVLPADTKTSVAYASPGHPFFPSEQTFTDAVLQRYQQGARFWVYAGHGQVTHLDRVPNTASGTPVLDQDSVLRLKRPPACSPIAVMLSCYTGAMDAAEDSIAEEMILCEGGPIAVFAGSRVTMPYGNTTAAVGLIEGVFEQRVPRLGDAWLRTLKTMHQEISENKSSARVMIDSLAALISPAGTQLVDERREHMKLYNLIGDPTLRLNHPQPLTIKTPIGHEPGEPIEVQIESPIDGKLTLNFDRPLGGVSEGDPNDTTVASVALEVVAAKPASANVVLPQEVKGPIIVRAFVAGDQQWASGAKKTSIR